MSQIAFKRNYVQHALAISRWIKAQGATGSQDAATLIMALSLGGKSHILYPQFTAQTEQGLRFFPQLNPGGTGFVGFYPNVGKAWDWAQTKLAFKAFAQSQDLRTPAWSQDSAQVKGAYLIKTDRSSLGQGQRGPYAQRPEAAAPPHALQDNEYYEQFIFGHMLKAWYWNGELCVVEIIPMPSVKGDGASSIAQLLEQQFPHFPAHALSPADQAQRHHLLALQGGSLSSIPPAGSSITIDYQYMAATNPAIYIDHNCRESIRGSAVEAQLTHAGQVCLRALPPTLSAGGLLMSLDAIVDPQGQIWFLEANCNPLLHPAVYEPMLNSLFTEQISKPLHSNPLH